MLYLECQGVAGDFSFADKCPHTIRITLLLDRARQTDGVRTFVLRKESIVETKHCIGCGEVKSVVEFYKHAGHSDGLTSRCKACERARQKVYCNTHRAEACARAKAWREANPDRTKASKKAYYESHKAQVKSYQKRYRQANRERRSSQQKEWRARNPVRVRAVNGAWRKAHPEAVLAMEVQSRVRRRGVPGYASAAQRKARWDYYGGKCYICGTEAEAMDHVKPLSRGGCNLPCNLRPICTSCNSRKHNKWPYDFKEERRKSLDV